MTAPYFLTRTDLEDGRVKVDVSILGDAPSLTAEGEARLRARISEAIEEVLERELATCRN
ncbi:MAG: hypothetical protein JNK30_21070 [Phenylobacterium sp.]|uniref:hypothetical protein n=1 Tax=Phenylobacterium sp. TaxID=1871053 RepID=UPI001A55CD75|nr:hypothetical protein [Phenylobacterium sp.]MBL8773892.1 hypothetical protein [Phenylobacterium sp.]